MRAALALCAFLSPATALGCSLEPLVPSEMPEVGAGCAYTLNVAEFRTVGLMPIVHAAGGLYRQQLYDGNGCAWEANLLIQDCASREMLVIGDDRRDVMEVPQETGIDRITARMDAEALTLDQIEQLASAEGYGTNLRLAAGARLSINGQGLPTRCACAVYDPGAVGN